MDCKCEKDEVAGWWLNSSNVQMGAFTVVGYLLYRFSQTQNCSGSTGPINTALPALIRWPIRIFCSLTGISAIWGWVSRLVGTLRVIKSLCHWLSRIWKFIKALSSKFKWVAVVVRAITGSGDGSLQTNEGTDQEWSLRLILLGPSGGERTTVARTLLDCSEAQLGETPMNSTKRQTVVGGREVTVVDTPDLLGPSLRRDKRAREALRSLQLSTPGPHAFLLVIQAPGSGTENCQDVPKMIQATQELFGDDALGYIIPVVTHADGRGPTLEELLDVDAGGLQRAMSLCGQRPELVSNGPDQTPEEQSVTRTELMAHVMEMKDSRGHFVHELQRREDHMREELLTDMASALAKKL